MAKKFEKGSPEFNFFADLYGFTAEYYNPSTKEEWEKMFEEAEKLKEKYIDTTAKRMCCEMLVAFMKVKMDENAIKSKGVRFIE